MSSGREQVMTLDELEDDDVEQRAERIVKVESELRNQMDAASSDAPDHRLDLSRGGWLRQSGARRVPVEDIEKVDGHWNQALEIDVRIDDDIVTYCVPWPDNPLDESETLTRLCRTAGTTPDRLGDLDEVPVVRDVDGGWRLFVPPSGEGRTVEVVLPGGSSGSTSLPTICSVYAAVHAPLLYRLCQAGIARFKSSGRDGADMLTTRTAIFLIIVAPWLTALPALTLPVDYPLAVILTLILHAALFLPIIEGAGVDFVERQD